MSPVKLFKQKFGILAAAAGLALGFAASAQAVQGPFLPPEGKKLLIIGQDINSIDAYKNDLGITPGGVTSYINLSDLSGLTTQVDNGAGANNAGYLQANYPNSVHAVAVYLVNQLNGVNNGTYDGQMDELIRVLKSWKRPVFLRWGYEADGPWNSYEPTAYRNAFIRMANKVKAAGASNIAMVWQTMSYCPIDSDINQWYPGDQYVDWVGLSYFAPQDCNWREVNKTVNFARSKNKPVLIAESSPQRYDLSSGTYNPEAQRKVADQARSGTQIWNEWFANYFNYIQTNGDVIKAAAYINADWDSQSLWAAPYPQGYWGDSRVQSNNVVRDLWVNEVNSGRWLNASSTLFATLTGTAGSSSVSSQASSSSSVKSSSSVSSISSVSSVSSVASSSVSTGTSNGVFGLTASGVLYHLDGGQTGSFVYLCVNGDCRTPTKTNGRYERNIAPVTAGTSYSVEFKIQDNATGQCLASASFTPGQAKSTSPCYSGSVAVSSTVASSSSVVVSSSSKSSVASSAAVSSTASSVALTCQSATNPSHVESGRRTEFTQEWCDTVCVTYIANGTACLNKSGTLVTNASICSDPANAREAMLDIEYNLHINIDDQFVSMAGYQGAVPSINPRLSIADTRTYFSALLGPEKGVELANRLNTNGDGWVDRNEASAAKGADPLQLLNTGFGCGLSTDDIMAYVGLYMGDGAIDKYAGDLDPAVKAAMLKFTRSWQPGVHAQACEYRGGCDGTSSSSSSVSSSSSLAVSSSSSVASSTAPSSNCPVSHPFWSASCQRCFTDAAQATSASCN